MEQVKNRCKGIDESISIPRDAVSVWLYPLTARVDSPNRVDSTCRRLVCTDVHPAPASVRHTCTSPNPQLTTSRPNSVSLIEICQGPQPDKTSKHGKVDKVPFSYLVSAVDRAKSSQVRLKLFGVVLGAVAPSSRECGCFRPSTTAFR